MRSSAKGTLRVKRKRKKRKKRENQKGKIVTVVDRVIVGVAVKVRIVRNDVNVKGERGKSDVKRGEVRRFGRRRRNGVRRKSEGERGRSGAIESAVDLESESLRQLRRLRWFI